MTKTMAQNQTSRGTRTKNAITQATIEILAKEGIAAVTHRRVASIAKVSLASTTYHFATKSDLINTAALTLFENLKIFIANALNNILEKSAGRRPPEIRRLVSVSLSDYDPTQFLASAELLFFCIAQKENENTIKIGYSDLIKTWFTFFERCSPQTTRLEIQTEFDTIFGYFFVLLTLGATPIQIRKVVCGEEIPSVALKLSEKSSGASTESIKESQTATQVLEAALNIIIERGYSSLTYRSITDRSGISQSLAAYHFGSISALIADTHIELFNAAKSRYKSAFDIHESKPNSIQRVTDITSTVFIREATEFRLDSAAYYSLWVLARRESELRPLIENFVLDLLAGWQRRLTRIGQSSEFSALRMQALFIGQLIRIIATGSNTSQLVDACSEFRVALSQEVECRQ